MNIPLPSQWQKGSSVPGEIGLWLSCLSMLMRGEHFCADAAQLALAFWLGCSRPMRGRTSPEVQGDVWSFLARPLTRKQDRYCGIVVDEVLK